MLSKLSKRFKYSTVNFVLFFISVQYCLSAPVENIYSKFINDLNSNECAIPEQINTLSNSTSAENLAILSSSLSICQNLDTVTRIKEAQYLCREIFDNLKVVLCPNSKDIIKHLNITFSKQVCQDIASLKNVSKNTFLLKHLTDNWSCDMLCDGVFERACQVLHWSYLARKDIEGNAHINNDVNTGSSIQESNLDSDKQKSQEPNKAKENVQKTAEMTPEQTKNTVQQPSNTLVLGSQKINLPLDHVQKQTDKLQPNVISDVLTPVPAILKDVGGNSILPVLQGKDVKGVAPKASQEDVLNNDLQEDDTAGNNAGFPEMEEPHDNEAIFSHNVDPGLNSSKELPQPLTNNQLSSFSSNMQLSNMLTDGREPNLPTNNDLSLLANDLQPANKELPQLNPSDGLVDPHDGEELGEESQSTNQKVQEPQITVGQTQAIKIEITNQNEANVQTQAKKDTALNGSTTTKAASSTGSPSTSKTASSTTKAASSTTKVASTTTKAASSTGSAKSSTTVQEKKVIEVKSSGLTEDTSTADDGKKKPENLLPLPSLKDSSSSAVPPISEDLSPAPANIEKMEGEEDAHEMPEDREPYQYNGIYEPSKNKESKPAKTIEVSKVDVGGQKGQTFDEFSPRSKYGPDDVPLIPVVFPEQEDGHFFFYFLSMVLILMAGYLIFHNKQKIIALIVEGRHERRRRSHGAGYKKLETK